MKTNHLKEMNLFDIVASAFADKLTIGASLGSFIMFKFSGFDFDILAVLPAVLIFGAAIYKHYQRGRKAKAEAEKSITERELLEKQLELADKELHESIIENKILLEKLEQEKIKTNKLRNEKA